MTTATLVYYAFAFIVGTVTVGRVTRLVVDDDFPPVVWLRGWWIRNAPEKWADLAVCAFCISFWIAAVNGGLAWLSYNGDGKLDWWWWVPNLIFASAYIGAMINRRDIPAS